MDAGILVARVIVGLAIAAHGAQKLFGWFGGHGPKGTAGFFESLGFRPGVFFALAAGLGELGGGLLTAAGFLGPVGPALITLVMLVAIFTVHWAHGFFASSNGIELPLMYLTSVLPLAFVGPGAYSLDGRLGLIGRFDPATAWMVIGVAGALAVVNVAMRRVAPAPLRTHG
jgi:putative oxidoreductase